jgi:hypothetical protein
VRAAPLPPGRAWGCRRAALAIGGPGGDQQVVISSTGQAALVDPATLELSVRALAGDRLPSGRTLAARRLAGTGTLLVTAPGRRGVSVVDLTASAARTVDAGARAAAAVGARIWTFDGDAVALRRGSGLTATGERPVQLLPGRQISHVQWWGDRLYALSGKSLYVVDAAGKARVLRRVPARRTRVRLLHREGPS